MPTHAGMARRSQASGHHTEEAPVGQCFKEAKRSAPGTADAPPAAPETARLSENQLGRRAIALHPLGAAQRRIWYFGKLAPGVPLYNESDAMRITGALDVKALQWALDAIVARHDALRTTICATKTGPMAEVHDAVEVRINKIDLSAFETAQREAELERLLRDEPRRPYELEKAPGIRASLIRLSARAHAFILMMHQLTGDRRSMGVLWRELASLYQAYRCGKPAELPTLSTPCGKHVARQPGRFERTDFRADLAYWQERLAGAPGLLELPADRPRPAVQTYRGLRRRFRLDSGLAERLRETSRRGQTSLFTIFAAVLNVLLYRYTGSEDVVIGIPVTNRDRNETQSLIGFLTDAHALRTRLAGELTFRELTQRVHTGLIDLYEHRQVPFDRVVDKLKPERSLSHSPLFQVMLNWRDKDQQLAFVGLDGLEVEPLLSETGTSKFDLTLFVMDSGEEILLEVEFSTELFDEARIERMVGHYRTLLGAVAEDAEQLLVELPLLTEEERRRVLLEWNATEEEYPKGRRLHELFEEQARRRPDAVAVACDGARLSYGELNERAESLAGELLSRGVHSGDLVGMFLDRSAALPVALLGILKAGAAYVPLDPEHPEERIGHVLEDAGVAIVVTEGALEAKIGGRGVTTVLWSGDGSGNTAIMARESARTAPDDDLAYVIYTSGSTGRPKGVAVRQDSVVNVVNSIGRLIGFGENDRLLAVTTPAFDIATLELLMPLLAGGRLIVADREGTRDPGRLRMLIAQSGATVMQATPATWRMLLDSGWTAPAGMTLLSGGDVLPRDLAERLQADGATLWNLYGPTETTIWSTAHRVVAGTGPVPIGRPLGNTRLYVLDGARKPVPAGISGQLWIGGSGVARGYRNRPELTDQKFQPDAFRAEAGARMYCTGDLARYRPDGELEYLGRGDQQVKLRGFRIELEEIEIALGLHVAVDQCVVIAREDEPGAKVLVAYVVLHEGKAEQPGGEQLRAFLRQKLPDYMIPAAFVRIEKLPLTANGKVDRKALPAPERWRNGARNDYVAPRNALEAAIGEIWGRMVGISHPGVSLNFFDLGGDSMRALQLLLQVKKELGYELPVAGFYRDPTIGGIARAIEERRIFENEPVLVTLKEGNRAAPIIFVQAELRLWKLARLVNSERAVVGTLVPWPAELLERPADARMVETLTAPHVAIIREQVRAERCVLVGHSFGGVLAFEAARQLAAEGISVEAILLLDARSKIDLAWWQKLYWFPSRQHMKLTWWSLNRWWRRHSSVATEDEPEELELATISREFGARWPRAFYPLAQELVGKHCFRPLICRAAYFQPDEMFGAFTAHQWRKLFTLGVEVVKVTGDHTTMLREPHLRLLAGGVNEYLRWLEKHASAASVGLQGQVRNYAAA